MKIAPNQPDALRADVKPLGADRAETSRSGAVAEPVKSPPAVDRVSLSGAAPHMGPEGLPSPFNDKKVEEVRRAIQEGRFPVDAKKVADSLLTDTRDLLRAAPRSAS